MYVCICNAVRDTDIHQAVNEGARDINDVASKLGVGTCCGSCRDYAQRLIDEVRSRQNRAGPTENPFYQAA